MDEFANYDRWLETNPFEEAQERQRKYDEWWDYMAGLADLEHGDIRDE